MYHSRSTLRRAPFAALTVAAVTAALMVTGPAAFADPPSAPSAADPGGSAPEYAKPTIVYDDLTLPDGRTAVVYSDGHAVIRDDVAGTREDRLLPAYDIMRQPTGTKLVASETQVLVDLTEGERTPYREGKVRVVLADGVSATEPVTTVPTATVDRVADLSGSALAAAAPDYTSSPALNQKLAHLGTERMAPIVATLPDSSTPEPGGINLANAYVLDVADSQTATAVEELLASPDVAYASPDWAVSPLKTPSIPVSQADVDRALAASQNPVPAATPADSADDSAPLPTNYALSASMQSLLNRPGINWTEAYQILQERYGQLPGEGQIITNVSVGYLTDATTPLNDFCRRLAAPYGPTTVVKDGQRYLDLPSLPLIPAFTAEPDGTLNPTGTSCGTDPLDAEIDLDFAVMAGLPHDQQRDGATGEGYTDLLGVAPGADYRLVVPAGFTTNVSDIDTALLAAAQQEPRPDVITASLGFGFDTLGFPSRYLEEDPITQAVVSTITHDFGITVTIAAGDGLRQFTRAAWGPSGGSAALNVAGPGQTPTDLADLQASTAPSLVADSGAIAVGGTTLDDIFSAPPQDPANAELAARHAFPITRFNGMRTFSSGFGSRVNVSAPGDNILSFQHAKNGQATRVEPVINGGTSASAPIVAATAAVVKQTAELVGDTELAADPLRIRSWLEQTGTPVPNAPQADPLHVGPQVDLGTAVSRLVSDRAGYASPAGVARVAVEQRRPFDERGGVFLGDTDAANISLADDGQVAWITIAPDWTGKVASDRARYALTVGGTTLASTSYARLSPERILTAAGEEFPPTEPTSITLTYTARHRGSHVSVDVPLTFTPVSGSLVPLAPLVPTVATGDTFPVTYDMSMFSDIEHPVLIVTGQGRISPWDLGWHIMYQKVLDDFAGTVEVPVDALQGGGIYGVGIQGGLTGVNTLKFSHFAAIRIPGARSDTRPPAPTVSLAGEEPGHHTLSVDYTDRVTVRWDVRNVPHATGARLEVSSVGPTFDVGSSFNTVNNPNGTIRDDNQLDTGSVIDLNLPGTHGQITLSGDELGLVPAGYQQVRVRPLRWFAPAGEASDVSTIHRGGITGPDGQGIQSFGVDPRGGTGVIVSSSGSFGNGHATVSTFDQATGESTGVLWESTTQRLTGVGTSGPNMFAGHTALIEALDRETRQLSFSAIDVNTGERHAWEPPAGYLPEGTEVTGSWFLAAANEPNSPNAAFVVRKTGDAGWHVFSSNVAAGTFGPMIDLSPSLSTMVKPIFAGVAQDPTTNTAYLHVYDNTHGVLFHAYVVEVNLVDGSQRVIDLRAETQDIWDGIAVDSASHTAIVAGIFAVYRIDLDTDEVRRIDPSGGATGRHGWITNDPTRGLYLDFDEVGIGAQQPNRNAPGNGWTLAIDANRVSNVDVLDTDGHVTAVLPSFLLPTPGRIGSINMQVDPSTGTGYVIGGDFVSLRPFRYAD